MRVHFADPPILINDDPTSLTLPELPEYMKTLLEKRDNADVELVIGEGEEKAVFPVKKAMLMTIFPTLADYKPKPLPADSVLALLPEYHLPTTPTFTIPLFSLLLLLIYQQTIPTSQNIALPDLTLADLEALIDLSEHYGCVYTRASAASLVQQVEGGDCVEGFYLACRLGDEELARGFMKKFDEVPVQAQGQGQGRPQAYQHPAPAYANDFIYGGGRRARSLSDDSDDLAVYNPGHGHDLYPPRSKPFELALLQPKHWKNLPPNVLQNLGLLATKATRHALQGYGGSYWAEVGAGRFELGGWLEEGKFVRGSGAKEGREQGGRGAVDGGGGARERVQARGRGILGRVERRRNGDSRY